MNAFTFELARIRVSSVYKGRDFLYELVKTYANQE
jgi:hypothetical protein